MYVVIYEKLLIQSIKFKHVHIEFDLIYVRDRAQNYIVNLVLVTSRSLL